jgi:glycosyltransferase involved in cell wall biosynthesis
MGILIDASNLRVGGGVVVAGSFLDELADIQSMLGRGSSYSWIDEVTAIVSPEVAAIMRPNNPFRSIVSSATPLQRAIRWLHPQLERPESDVEFCIFGPTYGPRRARRTIVGFADGTSLVRGSGSALSHTLQARRLVRAAASRASFATADVIVVEAASVADLLNRRWKVPLSKVRIVPNTCHAAFTNMSSAKAWESEAPRTVSFLYPARAYPHKNHDFLGELGRALESKFSLHPVFVVTLTAREWADRSDAFRQYARNLGPQDVRALPALYAEADAVIFPSLLESVSVTPLEALSSARPLFASDRDFVRSIAGDSATYFDPTEPYSAAKRIFDALQNTKRLREMVLGGLLVANSWPTPRDRARAYVKLIDDEFENAGAGG